mmetsp:Transcript_27255/g.65657  ORF Transcript_27255/g.65657 Transcript_27255/m.65657 type:complete len:252 (-) Transcript_27255:291-1046(-)
MVMTRRDLNHAIKASQRSPLPQHHRWRGTQLVLVVAADAPHVTKIRQPQCVVTAGSNFHEKRVPPASSANRDFIDFRLGTLVLQLAENLSPLPNRPFHVHGQSMSRTNRNRANPAGPFKNRKLLWKEFMRLYASAKQPVPVFAPGICHAQMTDPEADACSTCNRNQANSTQASQLRRNQDGRRLPRLSPEAQVAETTVEPPRERLSSVGDCHGGIVSRGYAPHARQVHPLRVQIRIGPCLCFSHAKLPPGI